MVIDPGWGEKKKKRERTSEMSDLSSSSPSLRHQSVTGPALDPDQRARHGSPCQCISDFRTVRGKLCGRLDYDRFLEDEEVLFESDP